MGLVAQQAAGSNVLDRNLTRAPTWWRSEAWRWTTGFATAGMAPRAS